MHDYHCQEDSAANIQSTHDALIRTIGGKQLRRFTMICSPDDSDCSVSEAFTDAKLLKNGRRICICGKDRNQLPYFELPLNEVCEYQFTQTDGKCVVRVSDGDVWELVMEVDT